MVRGSSRPEVRLDVRRERDPVKPGWTICEARPAEKVLRPAALMRGGGGRVREDDRPSRWIGIASGERLDQVPVLRFALGERAASARVRSAISRSRSARDAVTVARSAVIRLNERARLPDLVVALHRDLRAPGRPSR